MTVLSVFPPVLENTEIRGVNPTTRNKITGWFSSWRFIVLIGFWRVLFDNHLLISYFVFLHLQAFFNTRVMSLPVYSGKQILKGDFLIFSSNMSFLLRKRMMEVSVNHLLLQMLSNSFKDSFMRFCRKKNKTSFTDMHPQIQTHTHLLSYKWGHIYYGFLILSYRCIIQPLKFIF